MPINNWYTQYINYRSEENSIHKIFFGVSNRFEYLVILSKVKGTNSDEKHYETRFYQETTLCKL